MSNRGIKYLLRSDLLSVLTSFVILLSTACLTTDQGVDRNTNESVQASPALPSGGALIEEEDDGYKFVEESSARQIREICAKLGLAPLPKTAKPGKLELRIWTNLDDIVANRKLLIVRSGVSATAFVNDAYFFDMEKNADPLKFQKQHLTSPRSGWNKMLFDMRNKLTTPRGLVRDPDFPLERDEDLILLEVLDKGEYRLVLYGHKTSFPDGKRLIEVCNYLASEFDLDMNCRGKSGP